LYVDQPTAALAQLSQLFSKGRSSFFINMHHLQTRLSEGGHSSRAGRNGNRRKRDNGTTAATGAVDATLDNNRPTPGVEDQHCAEEAGIPESDYGLAPSSRKIGIYFEEKNVTYIARLRKAFRHFLDLQVRCGGLDVIQLACENLTLDDWKHEGYDDLRSMATGQYIVCLLLELMKVCPLETLAVTSEYSPDKTDGESTVDVQQPRLMHHRHLQRIASKIDAKSVDSVLVHAYNLFAAKTIHDSGEVSGSWSSEVVLPARFALELAETSRWPLPCADILNALFQDTGSTQITWSSLVASDRCGVCGT